MDITSSLTEQLSAILLRKKLPGWGALQDKMPDLLYLLGQGSPLPAVPVSLPTHKPVFPRGHECQGLPTRLPFVSQPTINCQPFLCSTELVASFGLELRRRLRLKGWFMQLKEPGIVLPLCSVPILPNKANKEVPYSKPSTLGTALLTKMQRNRMPRPQGIETRQCGLDLGARQSCPT